ncbi:hypothetical protein HanIR_Chr03g0118891 [Helianthus annuus]|nr:hypothetical protein HanIR_Chr03g0118891 [Helianthus annuus]
MTHDRLYLIVMTYAFVIKLKSSRTNKVNGEIETITYKLFGPLRETVIIQFDLGLGE